MIDLHPFRPRLLDSLRSYDRMRLRRDIGADVTVGIVALPLAMAFAIASGLEALQQLFRTLQAREVGLMLANVGQQPVSLMRRSGFEAVPGPEHIGPAVSAAFDDTPQRLVSDRP